MCVRKILKVIAICSMILGLVSCAQSGKNSYSRASKGLNSSVAAIGDVTRFYGEEVSAEKERALLDTKVLHFGYNKFDISPKNKLVLFAHAKKLLQNPNFKLRIDGHTDERGSREFNIGLGERRANAVAKILALKGVAADRIVTVSYGKERPVSVGHDESSWQWNRRAELNYEEQS